MPSISIVFRKDKLNKKSEAPIHFRIIKNRKVRYISSGQMLHQKHWDGKKNKVKSSFKNSARLNNLLTTKLSEFQSKILEAETTNDKKSSAYLRELIVGKKNIDFFSFADKIVESYQLKNQIGTYDKSKSIIAKLKGYFDGKSTSFKEISPSLLSDYEQYLRREHKNKTNTILRDMKFISKIFNDAYREELIEHKDNPFLRYKKPKEEKTKKEYLAEEELERLENLEMIENTKIATHRDIFIFSCNGGGERISDLFTLEWKNFDGTHINFSTTKTETQLSILLPKKALAILKKYKKKNTRFVFPILKEDLDLNNARQLDNDISSATALMNKNLKKIAKRAEIEKNISTHTARHTWATRALRKGISIDKVSKILGHSNIKQTQVYAKIVSSELDKAMQAFDE